MNPLKQLLTSIQFIGLPDTLRVIRSSLLRDWYEWRFRAPTPESTPHTPGDLLNADATPQGGLFTFTNADLEIHFLTPHLVRISWNPGRFNKDTQRRESYPGGSGDPPRARKNAVFTARAGLPNPADPDTFCRLPLPYAIAKTDWPEVKVSLVGEDGGGHTLTSGGLTLTVGVGGGIVYRTGDGDLLRVEHPPRWTGGGWTQRSRLDSGGQIHGLGERAAPLNLRDAIPHGKTIPHSGHGHLPNAEHRPGRALRSRR